MAQAPAIENYCLQLGGKIISMVDWGYNELSSQKCYKMMCETSTSLKILKGKQGEDIKFERVDEDMVAFRVCQDKVFGALKNDVKIHFSYVDFDQSQGSIETFFLKGSEPCWKQCLKEHKDSTDYDCKHCVRAHYYPKLTDVNFELLSYQKQAPTCLSHYDHQSCSSERIPASNEQDVYLIDDVVEEMWCDIVEDKNQVRCKGIDYTQTKEKLKKYFINVPLTPAPEYSYIDGEEIRKTDVQVVCLNTGKTPFDLKYKYVSCSDGIVYQMNSEITRAKESSQSFDGNRVPASKK